MRKNKKKINNYLDGTIVELEESEILIAIEALINRAAIWLGTYSHNVGLI